MNALKKDSIMKTLTRGMECQKSVLLLHNIGCLSGIGVLYVGDGAK